MIFLGITIRAQLAGITTTLAFAENFVQNDFPSTVQFIGGQNALNSYTHRVDQILLSNNLGGTCNFSPYTRPTVSNTYPSGMNDPDFPDFDNFVVQGWANLHVGIAGEYTFIIRSDDGFRLTISKASPSFTCTTSKAFGSSATDTRLVCNFPTASIYSFEFIYYESGGNSCFFVYYAPGNIASYSSTTFKVLSKGTSTSELGLDASTPPPFTPTLPAFNPPTLREAGVRVRVRKAGPGVDLNNVEITERLLRGVISFLAQNDITITKPYVDFGSSPGFLSTTTMAFPSPPGVAAPTNQIGLEAIGYIAIPSDNNYKFCVYSDDGFSLELFPDRRSSAANLLMSHLNYRGAVRTCKTFALVTGEVPFRLLYVQYHIFPSI